MTYYRYNALDIAAYIKWTSIPAETERTYLDLLFQMREQILARPLAKDFESFAMAVFREMYHVWARGFENEFSDVNLIAPEGSIALLCDQQFLALESYMKLLSLHLILTENLPYIRINFVGLPLLIGVEGEVGSFEKNLAEAARMLRLTVKDNTGDLVDLSQGIPNEALGLALDSEFRAELFGAGGYRVKRSNDYQEKMRVLREKSRREQEVRDILKTGVDARKDRKGFLRGIPVVFTPTQTDSETDQVQDYPVDLPVIPDSTLNTVEDIISPPQEPGTQVPAEETVPDEKPDKTKKKR